MFLDQTTIKHALSFQRGEFFFWYDTATPILIDLNLMYMYLVMLILLSYTYIHTYIYIRDCYNELEIDSILPSDLRKWAANCNLESINLSGGLRL